MNNSLESFLRHEVDVLEKLGVFEIGTDTVRAWIDIFNNNTNSITRIWIN